MELESMFSEQKWNIIKCLSENKFSPLQLAEKLDTSMANISQQLRLLEASNLVSKEKIKNRDRGKPRTLFSLSNDYAYLVSASNNFADKKLLKTTDHQKIILRIWFIDDQDLQIKVEKIYWKLRKHLNRLNNLYVNLETGIVYAITDQIDKIQNTCKKSNLDVKVLTKKEFNKEVNSSEIKNTSPHSFYKIYSEKIMEEPGKKSS